MEMGMELMVLSTDINDDDGNSIIISNNDNVDDAGENSHSTDIGKDDIDNINNKDEDT